MSYEIDFVGVKADKCTKDADAICLRWKVGEKIDGTPIYKIGVVAYYLAYLKVHDYSPEAKMTVAAQMEVLESALREGCIGQLPEIYDGEIPVSSKGCFAQAWSVGEILRVYEKLEKK